MSQLTNPPVKIYLQYFGDQKPEEGTKIDHDSVTWDTEPAFSDDVEYVRADDVRKHLLVIGMMKGDEICRCPVCKSAWSPVEVTRMATNAKGGCMCGKWSFDVAQFAEI